MPYSEIRLSTHAFVPDGELVADAEKIAETLTIRSRYEETLSLSLYRRRPGYFGYPLYMRDYALHTDNLIDERSPGTRIAVEMAENFSLRQNQVALLNRFSVQLNSGRTGWLINMPTGSGKTVCACVMLQKISTTTLVIVPRESLLEQWSERIQQFTTIQAHEIGLARQGICDFEGKKVVLGMIHSLAKDKYSEAFKRYFGLVIWDEVHVAAAQSFSQTLSLFAPRYRIGMSATMRRRDGLDAIYKWAIGEQTLSIDGHTLVQPTVYVQHYTAKKKNGRLAHIDNAQHRRGVLITALSKDKERNALLSVQIKKIALTKRRLLVFSERKDQLELLRGLLITRKDIDPSSVRLFTGDTPENERREILSSCPIILATYGVMSMGVDVPDLRAVVFATPQASIAQSVGRILRICEGTLDPLVMDLIDDVYPDCIHWASARIHYYQTTAQAKIIEL